MKSSDRRRSLLGVCLTAALCVSCGTPDGDSGGGESIEQARQEIIGGTLTRARPEVGHYLPIGCGGTLIASDFFITASHCLFYENQRPGGTFRITMTDGRRLDFPIRNTYSLGYSPGPHDVAVGQLADPVPTWVAMPARIETNVGPTPLVTQIGFGCTAWGREDHGEKRYITQQWRATSVGCPGDSGGPVFTGALADNGGLFAIASGVNEHGDFYGSPVPYQEYFEELMRSLSSSINRGLDRPGGDYLVASDPDWFGCSMRCAADPSCIAFAHSSAQQRCWLKNSLSEAVPVAGIDSGLAGAGYFDRPGMNILPPFGVSYDECLAMCASNSDCKSYAYDTSTGRCSLKSGVPPTAPCSSCVSNVRRAEWFLNRPGADLSTSPITVTSFFMCQRECSKEPACRAYTFDASTSKCWLKSRLVPANGVGSFLSGVKHGMEPNINRPGRDIKAVQLGSPYPQFCQSECARTPGCRSWTYVPPLPHPTDPNLPAITLAVCHVKSSLTPGIPAPGMVSGINFAEHF